MFYVKEKCNWSYIELKYLQDLSANIITDELCLYLGRSKDSILEKMYELGKLRKPHSKSNLRERIVCICKYNKCNQAFIRAKYELDRVGLNSGYCSTQCSHNSTKTKAPSYDEIFDDYMIEDLSTNQIATKRNLSKGTVYNLFKKYKINFRTDSAAQKIFYNTDAGQQSISKARDTKLKVHGKLAFIAKKKWQADLNLRTQSKWESNFLRYLNYKNIQWEYECKTFTFNVEGSKVRSYLPDIYLPKEDIWIEIKGRLSERDIIRTEFFKQYYPNEFKKLHAIVQKSDCEAAAFLKKSALL